MQSRKTWEGHAEKRRETEKSGGKQREMKRMEENGYKYLKRWGEDMQRKGESLEE